MKTENLFLTLGQGFMASFLLGVLAILVTAFWSGPRINLPGNWAVLLFFFFLAAYFLLSVFCVLSLPPGKMSKELIKTGPYKFVRHPMYTAILFLLTPALALLLKSWLILFSVLPAFFLWRSFAKKEEGILLDTFGREYLAYQQTTGMFFPRLLKINKFAFFVFWGLVLVGFIFLALNWQAFQKNSFLWAHQQKEEPEKQNQLASLSAATFVSKAENIFRPEGKKEFRLAEDRFYGNLFSASVSPQVLAETSVVNPAYTRRTTTSEQDSVKISKLNINAPLVFPKSSQEKDVNAALDLGVVIYPGSITPPEFGNLFLTGHSSVYFWNKTVYGQIFSQLNQLQPGDEITVNFSGFAYIYVVTAKEIKSPQEVQLIQPVNKSILTLMTCWPVGTDRQRLVVQAELK